ncbi:MAG: DedA family protein [Desulfobacterota bacterium]|nr:DedA family protein [Thermodesulfobacteriota bacterium]MDW8002242.1 DedA family protein [Deltaproteobacteria bacterium]
MEFLGAFFDFVLHIDKHLGSLIAQYGSWIYLLLFLIVFLETGFVVTPFLPGDSLLFACGTFCALGALDMEKVIILLSLAAIIGDTVNYWAGALLGPRVFRREDVRFLNKKHLERTQRFYEKYGGKTIVIARFVPIVRTFAPFVAGIGKMNYPKFLFYNVTGGVAWVVICTYLGYYFGNIPIVKSNFSLVILAIIIISLLPAIVEYVKIRFLAKAKEAHF